MILHLWNDSLLSSSLPIFADQSINFFQTNSRIFVANFYWVLL